MYSLKILILKIFKYLWLDRIIGKYIFKWSIDNHYGGESNTHFHTKTGWVIYCGRGVGARKDY